MSELLLWCQTDTGGNEPCLLYTSTLVKVLITVIEKTPSGGATLEELQDAYAEINDRRPSVRTIYRLIRRLNLFFDPLCYGEKPEPGEEDPAEDDTDEEMCIRDRHMGLLFQCFHPPL